MSTFIHPTYPLGVGAGSGSGGGGVAVVDGIGNFISADVATNPTGTTGTSLTLASGQGARFSGTPLPIRAMLWDTAEGNSNAALWAGRAEVIQITARSTDTLTIQRGLEGSSPVDFGSSIVKLWAGPTRERIDYLARVNGDYVLYVEDFVRYIGSTRFLNVSTFSGASVVGVNDSVSDNGHHGVVEMQTGTMSNGSARIFGAQQFMWANFPSITKGSMLFAVDWVVIIKTGSNLSDSTNTYVINAGFPGDGPFEPVGGYFRYRHDTNGGRWQAVSRQSATSTADTGVSVAANTWYHLRIRWNGSELLYFIDGVLVATISTNIPNNFIGSGVVITKSAGTDDRTMLCDYLAWGYLSNRY